MTRIFLDASVIFSACYSSRGHSHDLILMAVRGEYDLVSSKLVVEEARRNLARTSEDYVLFLDFVLENITIQFVRPTKRQVLSAASHVALKDAPIIAAAKRAQVDLLVSLDKKHLLGKPELAKYAEADIVTPREAVAHIREMN
ncbi:MAG: PIN domain-containing protein [Chloroflexi bacterium]|nr:PIN domain-containing protein [Chloroflexota bacterium]